MFVNNIEVYMKKRKKFRNFSSMANSLEILKNFWNSFYWMSQVSAKKNKKVLDILVSKWKDKGLREFYFLVTIKDFLSFFIDCPGHCMKHKKDVWIFCWVSQVSRWNIKNIRDFCFYVTIKIFELFLLAVSCLCISHYSWASKSLFSLAWYLLLL